MIYTVEKDGSLTPGRRHRAVNAGSGPIKSVNAGVGVSQVDEANRQMAEAGLDVKYDPDGNMHARDRRTFLKALKQRGLHSNTDGL